MTVDVAAALILEGIRIYGRLADAIRKAREEGRKELTKEELDEFRRADDAARDALQAEIDRQTT